MIKVADFLRLIRIDLFILFKLNNCDLSLGLILIKFSVYISLRTDECKPNYSHLEFIRIENSVSISTISYWFELIRIGNLIRIHSD